MERKIGEKFLTPEGVELEVVLAVSFCKWCYYTANKECNIKEVEDNIGLCSRKERTDGKEVIFKQTK
jgi:hypothetical protein